MAALMLPAGTTGIYEIINTRNGKRYVGSAKDFAKRWKAHLFHLGRGTHHSRHLQSSWVRHGADAFAFRCLLLCEAPDLLMYEQIAIDALAPEFNTARFAGSCLGVKHTDATKAKLAARMAGNTHTLGYKHRPESIEKLRAKQTGVQSPTKGKLRDPAAVEATAAAHRGMKRSAETRARIAAKAVGRRWTDEAKAKLSATNTGRPMAEQTRLNLLGNKFAAGRKQTPEEKQRRAESGRAAWAAKRASGLPWRPPKAP